MHDIQPFIPGLRLCELFYWQAVRPILDQRFPGLIHAAAHLGRGSDVLGFDTARSTDHHWGPKTELFLSQEDHDRHAAAIVDALRHALPYDIHGYPTHFATPEVSGGILQRITSGPIRHGVTVWTPRSFFLQNLNLDPGEQIGIVDWLTFPQQHLRAVTAGKLFHDPLGELEAIRARLSYYPRDVWLYQLAAGWGRIGQEEPFVGRTGDVDDDLGSRVIAARLVRDVMRLCFLMERTYAPYAKWFGTAFARLHCGPALGPLLERALQANSWPEREGLLAQAYEALAAMHNALGITAPLPARVSCFHDRPYRVIHGDVFATAIRETIGDEEIRRLPLIGAVDQWIDATDVLAFNEQLDRLKALYQDHFISARLHERGQ